MSLLFDKKNQKAFKWVWIIFAAVIVLSMVASVLVGVGTV
jgi:hypothetical protein